MAKTVVEVRALPQVLQRALQSVGFRKRDISVETAETYSPSSNPFEGNRAYIVVVNLSSGQFETTEGSWGGANPFVQKQVDVDRSRYPIPPNGAVIKGESGGRGSFARILLHPSNMAQLLPEEEKLSEEEEYALNAIGGYKAGYRAEEFRRRRLGEYSVHNPLVAGLISKGFLQANRAGAIQITTKGKAYRVTHKLQFKLGFRQKLSMFARG